MSGTNCNGQALHGKKDLQAIYCYSMTYLDPTESVIIANVTPGQKWLTFRTLDAGTSCTAHRLGFVILLQISGVSISTNTANEIPSTKSMVPCVVKLSNYKGLSLPSPYHVDLGYSQFSIGLLVSVTTQLAALSAFATGCALYGSTNVITLAACIAGPISSGTSTIDLSVHLRLPRRDY